MERTTGLTREGVPYLDGAENGMCLARQADDYGPLLDRLSGIFDLEDAALRRAGPVGLANELGRDKARHGGECEIIQGDRVVIVIVPEHSDDRVSPGVCSVEATTSWGGHESGLSGFSVRFRGGGEGGGTAAGQFVTYECSLRCGHEVTEQVDGQVWWMVGWWWSTRRGSFAWPGSSSCRCSGPKLNPYWLQAGDAAGPRQKGTKQK